MTLSEVKSWFLTLKNNYDPKGFDSSEDKDFCLLANGFWQAEGYIGGIFSSSAADINFYPICSATQLLSEESVKKKNFFLRLNKASSPMMVL